jgi:hypothetical protein
MDKACPPGYLVDLVLAVPDPTLRDPWKPIAFRRRYKVFMMGLLEAGRLLSDLDSLSSQFSESVVDWLLAGRPRLRQLLIR